MTDSSPTRKALAAEPLPPAVPNRFREPIYHVEDDAVDVGATEELGRWFFDHRDKFTRGGDEAGVSRFNYELTDLDNYAPAELLAPFKRKLIEATADKATLEELATPEFDLRYVEMHATLYHHGSHFVWHDDYPGYDGEFVKSRRVTFCHYLHSEPKMFSGGELEFLDGTTVEPKNNRLCLFHPIQQHRVRKVECWSNHILHGRWALMGWVHGDAPEGWADRVPALRGKPQSG